MMLAHNRCLVLTVRMLNSQECKGGSKPLVNGSKPRFKVSSFRTTDSKLPLSKYKYQHSNLTKILGQVDTGNMLNEQARAGCTKRIPALTALIPKKEELLGS